MSISKCSLVGFVLAAFGSVPAQTDAPAVEGGLVMTRVPVGSGPLLCWEKPDETSGTRWNVHVVVEAGANEPPREFLRTRGNFDPELRLPDGRVLASSYQAPRGLLVLDLARGTWERLAESGSCDLRAHVDGKIIFDGPSRAGGGKEVWVWDAAKNEAARPFVPLLVEQWLAVDATRALVTTSSGELHVVDLVNGTTTKVEGFDPAWLKNYGLTAAPSPDGSKVALGVPRMGEKRGFGLVVLDVATGRRLVDLGGIDVRVSVASSLMPRLEVGWLKDAIVTFSETVGEGDAELTGQGSFRWVDVDVSTGERIHEEVYAPLGIRHRNPSERTFATAKRWTHGAFECDGTALYFRGEAEPLARQTTFTAPWGSFLLSPCGRYAAFGDGEKKQVRLVEATTRNARTVETEWCYDLVWLSPRR